MVLRAQLQPRVHRKGIMWDNAESHISSFYFSRPNEKNGCAVVYGICVHLCHCIKYLSFSKHFVQFYAYFESVPMSFSKNVYVREGVCV